MIRDPSVTVHALVALIVFVLHELVYICDLVSKLRDCHVILYSELHLDKQTIDMRVRIGVARVSELELAEDVSYDRKSCHLVTEYVIA